MRFKLYDDFLNEAATSPEEALAIFPKYFVVSKFNLDKKNLPKVVKVTRDGRISIPHKGSEVQLQHSFDLEKFPIRFSQVYSMHIGNNDHIRSLEGCPRTIGRPNSKSQFVVARCPGITSLKGGPDKVYGHFIAVDLPNLESAEGSPSFVADICAYRNNPKMVDLKGCAQFIGGDLTISECSGAQIVGGWTC